MPLHVVVDVDACVAVGHVLPEALGAEEHVRTDPALVLRPQVPRQSDLLGRGAPILYINLMVGVTIAGKFDVVAILEIALDIAD